MKPRGPDELREEISALVAEYHAVAFPALPFEPGKTRVPVSGKVFDALEMQSVVDAGLDFWLTAGHRTERFQKRLARAFGLSKAIFVNSGSSANLLAVSALTSPELGDRRLKPGDEVITVAAGFPTTVNPIIQNGLVPVFVDVNRSDLGIRVDKLEFARSERTRAIVLAHTLGNPFDSRAVRAFAKKHGLWFVEDCCDAMGSRLDGEHVGTFSDLATVSFYPAHHITTGEGGAVLTSSPQLATLVESFRDWGRDCWCDTGTDNACGKRFGWQLGTLPAGYDHKYIYSHIGYNLKATDLQAAVGDAQLDKLEEFAARRAENFDRWRSGLAPLASVLAPATTIDGATPCWFGFPVSVLEAARFTRRELIAHLTAHRIETRLLFGGNLTRQPAYKDAAYRVVGSLEDTDWLMERTFWLGVYPGITAQMIDYAVDLIGAFVKAKQ
jgi:CDP-4-dehydro-6-deoxyglucose reductase, E1